MRKSICLYLSIALLFLPLKWSCKVEENFVSTVRNTIIEKNINNGDGVRIAIIDSGINSNFVCSSNCINFSNEIDIEDNFDHGMPIYNIIKNDSVGIATDSEVFSIKVMDDFGITSMIALENALTWCFKNDIDVINLSLSYSIYNENIEAIIEMLIEKGVIIVAAINNNSVDIDYPAIYDGVIAVGYTENMLNYNNNLSIFFKKMYPIETISCDGFAKEYVGNSYLAPVVTGIVACIISENQIRMKEGNYIEQLVSQAKELLFSKTFN